MQVHMLAQAIRSGDSAKVSAIQNQLVSEISRATGVDWQTAQSSAWLMLAIASSLTGSGCPHNPQLFCPHANSAGCRPDDDCVIYSIWENTRP